MDDYNPLAGRQAEFIERIPPKAAIWDSLQTELALHARTRQDRDEYKLRLEQMTASYEVLKAKYEDDACELAELRAWKAEALAWPPADGLTSVESKVLAAEPAVTDWRTA